MLLTTGLAQKFNEIKQSLCLKGGESSSQFQWFTIAKIQLLMDCSYVIAFSRQNDWTSKRHYKALDVTVNQRIILLVGIFKEFDCKVILL